MKKLSSHEQLKSYVSIADIHAKRLQTGVDRIKKIQPITSSDLESITDENLGYLEMLSSRFGKLQDLVGARIFPALLEALEEDDNSMINKLNKLEKLEYVPSSEKLRNGPAVALQSSML